MPGRFRAGDTIGGYRLERLLGEGGTASVFLAERLSDGERVALKLLRAELGGDDLERRRFEHEARAAAAVRHRNLVALLDAGEERGRHFHVVELVDGVTLSERIRREGQLSLRELLQVAADAGAALDALHDAALLHRDVKPSNVLLRPDGGALLTDFGLARGVGYTVLTRPGEAVGTLDYMAPELFKGERANVSTDVYALGCTVYACIAGAPPFGGRSFIEVASAHLHETPSDPGAERTDWSPALGDVVLGALAKDPAARPPRAGAFAAVLRAAAGHASL